MLTFQRKIQITINLLNILSVLLKKRLKIPFNSNLYYLLEFDFLIFDTLLLKDELSKYDIILMLQKFYNLNKEFDTIITTLNYYISEYQAIDEMPLLDILYIIYEETCYVEDFLFLIDYNNRNINYYFFKKNILDLDLTKEFYILEEYIETYINFQNILFQTFLLSSLKYFNERLHNFCIKIEILNDPIYKLFKINFIITHKKLK